MGWNALIDPAAILVAAFGGAWLAFRLERKRRDDDEIQRRVGAANRALYTLFNFWNILEQFRKEAIEPLRGKHDQWLNMPATVPTKYGLTAFEAGELSFLLQTENAMVFSTLLLEEQRFAQAVHMIELRSSIVLNQVFPRFATAGVRVGGTLLEPDVEKIIGNDTVHKLKVLGESIVANVDANLKSIVTAHDQLRAAMKRLYPKRKFIKVEFGVVEPHAQTPAA